MTEDNKTTVQVAMETDKHGNPCLYEVWMHGKDIDTWEEFYLRRVDAIAAARQMVEDIRWSDGLRDLFTEDGEPQPGVKITEETRKGSFCITVSTKSNERAITISVRTTHVY